MTFATQQDAINYAESQLLIVGDDGWNIHDGYEAWSLNCVGAGWTVNFY
ncbi:hypothetical protein [Breznakia pachnodae]|uniref:Uncharacterized protein n=1 Tax=Breznakia pachnodae TaxID=265178 RepID=A0ABU0DZC7_9FIRM|nr:hypothetical protein [Breznakia pachnodae]MDQ0359994.1 hypothetical protein [Breznakia pachnodae]